jgi:hypothetical protein
VRLAEVVLWGSLAVTLYAYGLYPLVIWAFSRWKRSPAEGDRAIAADEWPNVTLLIRAGRDEHCIVKRLENALALDYPRERLQILVGCAGEDDLTGLLARSFDRRLVEVVQIPKRGDAPVLAACLRQVRGEIVFLSDARTLMRFDALRRIAEDFCHEPSVGGVCGKVRVVGLSGRDALDGRFAGLENFLTRCEGRLEPFPEVKSGLFAVRADLFARLGEQQPVDAAAIAMEVLRQGYRLVYDERAVATRDAFPQLDKSAARRRGHSATLWRFGSSNPALDRRRGVVATTFWMHRVLRRMCPALWIAAFVSNACLLENPFYLHVMLFHESFYVAALVALYFASGNRGRRLEKWFGTAASETDSPSYTLNLIPSCGRPNPGSDAAFASTRTAH